MMAFDMDSQFVAAHVLVITYWTMMELLRKMSPFMPLEMFDVCEGFSTYMTNIIPHTEMLVLMFA